MRTIYVRLYLILELVVFYFLVRRGYIRKVSVQLVPEYFSRDCSSDSISYSERKNWKKTRLKQCKKEGKSKCCCRRQSTWLIIALLSNRYCSAVAPILLRCRSVVPLLPHRYRTAIAPISHRYRSDVATPLSVRCRAAVTPLPHRYQSTVAPMRLLLLSIRSCTAITLLQRLC